MLPKDKARRNLVLCTDGSDAAYKAFEIALHEFVEDNDFFYVLHISNCDKTYLPEEFQLTSEKYAINVKERDENAFDTIYKQLAYTASKMKADYLFIGNFGRKGVKQDAYRIGHCAMNLVRLSKVPLVVIKKEFERKKNTTKGYNFICCLDGSKKANSCLKHAQDLACGEYDKIYAVTALDPELGEEEKQAEIDQLVEKAKEEQGVEFEHIAIDIKDEDTGKTLSDYVNFNEEVLFDFILFGNCGKRAETVEGYFTGRIADHLIKKCYLNPVVIP